jgi:hypothetical protein
MDDLNFDTGETEALFILGELVLDAKQNEIEIEKLAKASCEYRNKLQTCRAVIQNEIIRINYTPPNIQQHLLALEEK